MVLASASVFGHAELAVDSAHLRRVPENQRDEDVDRTLLREPEAQRIAAQLDGVELLGEQNAGAVRRQESNDQDFGQQRQRCGPIGPCMVVQGHGCSSDGWCESAACRPPYPHHRRRCVTWHDPVTPLQPAERNRVSAAELGKTPIPTAGPAPPRPVATVTAGLAAPSRRPTPAPRAATRSLPASACRVCAATGPRG